MDAAAVENVSAESASQEVLALLHDELTGQTVRSLPALLDALAAQLTGAVRAKASLLFAVDADGELLAAGAAMELGTPVARLFRAASEAVAHRSRPSSLRWLPLDVGPGYPYPECGLAAAALGPRGSLAGIVVVVLPWDTDLETIECRLGALAPLLAVAVLSARRSEAWRRLERLQSVLREFFAGSRPQEAQWPLDCLVEQIRVLFRADVATLLLTDDEELRLAASTDTSLSTGEPVVYVAGQGLTGWVFEHNRPLRLTAASDRDEVRRLTGLERHGPQHAERDATGEPTVVFLGVPMRFAGRVVGVLRLSRRQGSGRFSEEDAQSLQVVADLLGGGLGRSREALLANSVLDSLSEAIAASSRDATGDASSARIVFANRGAARLLGRPRSKLLGRPAADLYAPEDYERLRAKLKDAVQRARDHGRSEFGPEHCRVRKADGALEAVTISFRVVKNPLFRPALYYTIGIARPASESEELAGRHQRMLELLDATGIVYFRADAEGHTLDSTPMDERLTGYSRAELAAMRREQLFFEPGKRGLLVAEAARKGGLKTGVTVRLRRKNGDSLWTAADFRVLFGPGGEDLGVEGFYRDVTDRMRLQHFVNANEEELLPDSELFRRLKQDAELQLDYLSSIGHQIQAPLGALVGTMQNFEDRIYSENELLDRLPWVRGQARVCGLLVRNLSFMDKILRGEAFAAEAISLAKLAIETKLNFAHLLRDRRLHLEVDDHSIDRLQQIDGHPELMRQVLVNLIDNAVKYSESGTTITVRGHHWLKGRVLEVGNHGLPIPEEDRRRVFERGFRTPAARQRIPHGTGLGLWLVQRIVELHQAAIQCNVVPDGSRHRVLFQIVFPHLRAQQSGRRLS